MNWKRLSGVSVRRSARRLTHGKPENTNISLKHRESPVYSIETATTRKWRWLLDFCHRASHGFRPPHIVQPLLKGDIEHTTGVLAHGTAEPLRAALEPSVPIGTVHRPTPGRWTTRTARVSGGGSLKKGHGVDGSFMCHRLELGCGRRKINQVVFFQVGEKP